MRRYEYRRDTIGQDEWPQECNRLGAEGWRLFKMEWQHDGSFAPHICYFERVVDDRDAAIRLLHERPAREQCDE